MSERTRVLCVEDDPTLRVILEPLLQDVSPLVIVKWVDSAESAFEKIAEARERYRTSPFDLIITDIFLDGKVTGIDLWKVCRAAYPSMPVMVMSSLPFDKFQDFRDDDGIQPIYLQKPLNIAACRRLISGVLSRGPGAQLGK